MTITSFPARNEYTATAGQTVFNYTFKITAADEISVYITPSGQAANDSTDITTAYTVTSGINDPNGGTITLDSGASAGDAVTLVSNIPYDRTVDYQNSGDFLPDTVNGDNDRQVAQIKQVAEVSGRSLVFPQSLQNATQLSLPSPEVGLYMRWRADLLGLENTGAPGSILPSEVNGTASDMIANSSLNIGDFVLTTGYGIEGDGGDNLYEIVAAGTGTADGGSYIDLTGSGHQAKGLFPRRSVNVRQFGARGDGVTDDSAAFTNCGSYSNEVLIPSGSYSLDIDPSPTQNVTWNIDKGVSFTGSGTIEYSIQDKIISRGDYRGIESDPTFYEGIFQYLEQNAVETAYGNLGYHGSAKTSYRDVGQSGADIGVSAFAAQDLVGNLGGAWAFYGTAVRESGVNASCHAMELDIANMGSTVNLFPFSPFSAGQTHALWLGSGGEITDTSSNPGTASVAIGIISNDPDDIANFEKGIMFDRHALNGTDGVTGLGIAIAMATRQALAWYNSSNTKVGDIVSTNAAGTDKQRIDLSEFGFQIADLGDGTVQFQVQNTPSAANKVSVKASTATNPPQVLATGSDTNIDLELTPKGTGVVKTGYASQVATTPANFSADRYLEIKDSSGTSYYLPLMASPW